MAAPGFAPPYDTVEAVLNATRVRVNDAIQSLGGDVLKDDRPYTQVMTNAGWRRLQDFLVSLGVARFKNRSIIYALPVIAVVPPATQADVAAEQWMNWTMFFDGANYFTDKVLPQDFISPLRIWEKAGTQFLEMDDFPNGLPPVAKRWRNAAYQWKNDTLTLPGATSSVDLLLYYNSYLPDFIDQGSVLWHQQLVPIPRALDALADYIAVEVCRGRGDLDTDWFEQRAQASARIMWKRENLQALSVINQSELQKMAGPGTPAVDSQPSVKGS